MVPRTRGNYDLGVIEAPQIVASVRWRTARGGYSPLGSRLRIGAEVGDGALLRRLLRVGRSQEDCLGVPAKAWSGREAHGGSAYVCDDDVRIVGAGCLAHERRLYARRDGKHWHLLAAGVSDPRRTDDTPARQRRSRQQS